MTNLELEGSFFGNYGMYIVIVLGLICVGRGFMILTTGKIPAREEAILRDFSENGIRKYKMLSAVMNLIGGLLCVGCGVVRILNVLDTNLFRIIVIIVLVVMVAVFLVIRQSCKRMK